MSQVSRMGVAEGVVERAFPTTVRRERAATSLAARQHGVLSRQQALAIGLTDHQIRRRLRDGRWQRTDVTAVYRVAGHPVTWQQKAVAACLGAPEGAAASHLTAAALYGLHRHPDETHVTVTSGGSGRRSGMAVHRSSLQPGDTCAVQGVRATVPARTLVDCGAVLEVPALMGVVDTALCRKLTTPKKVLAAAHRLSPSGRRHGLAALHHVLDVWTEGIKPGSPAEMRLLRRLERWGFPTPVLQFEIRDRGGLFVARADVAWPDLTVGLEYDGREHHGPRAWDHDEARQRGVEALGWRFQRVEKVDLIDGAERLQEVLSYLLTVRRSLAG